MVFSVTPNMGRCLGRHSGKREESSSANYFWFYKITKFMNSRFFIKVQCRNWLKVILITVN